MGGEAIEGAVVSSAELADDSAAWAELGVAHGLDRSEADKLTKGQILDRLGLTDADVTIFEHKPFRIADKFALWALIKFGKIAKSGVQSDDIDGLAAMHDLLEQVIHANDWERFQQRLLDTKADDQQIMAVVADVVPKISERPTRRPSDTSDGSPETSPNSTDDSTSRVVHRLEQDGRPDLALLVTKTAEARAS